MSRRLAEIKSAIEGLAKRAVADQSSVVEASRTVLNAPLSPELNPDQIISAASDRIIIYKDAVARGTEVGGFAQQAVAGIAISEKNLLDPDKLAFRPEDVDAAIDQALGFAVQAEAKYFVDPKTGGVFRGQKVGQLRTGQPMAGLEALSRADGPLTPADLAKSMFPGDKKDKRKAGVVSPLLTSMSRDAVAQGLPPVISRGEEGFELLSPYEIISSFATQTEELSGKPKSYRIGEVLEADGIKGVLSIPQVRHLTQELLRPEYGDLIIGTHVVETRAQKRGSGDAVTRDLELTDEGLQIIQWVASKFGDKPRISVGKVSEGLKDAFGAKPIEAETSTTEEKEWFWGSHVAEEAGVTTGTLKAMVNLGALTDGIDFKTEQRGGKLITVYAGSAAKKARQVVAALPEGQNKITERVIRKALGLGESETESPVVGENPYGEYSSKLFTPQPIALTLGTFDYCLRSIRDQAQGPILADRDNDLKTELRQMQELAGVVSDVPKTRRQGAAIVWRFQQGKKRSLMPERQLFPKSYGLICAMVDDVAKHAPILSAVLPEYIINPPCAQGFTDENGLVISSKIVLPGGERKR